MARHRFLSLFGGGDNKMKPSVRWRGPTTPRVGRWTSMATRSKTTRTIGVKKPQARTLARTAKGDMRALQNVVRRAKAHTASMRAKRRRGQ